MEPLDNNISILQVAPPKTSPMTSALAELSNFLRSPEMRQLLRYCAPALVLGLTLRALMMWQMPYGYMQFDSADFLLTVQRLLTKGQFVIHSKRTFLVPLFYAVPFLLKIPALIFIPIVQHLLGLGVVLMSGALVRLWIRPWKWLIVPVTLALAANPVLLWFEHALMSESVYLFAVFTLALAGTLFAQRRTVPSFVFLLAGLFLAAGARPEGRLFLGFGFALVVLVDWGRWKLLAQRLGALTAFALVLLPITRTGQAGQLLYATVLPLAPDDSRVDPVFGRAVRPLRDRIREQAPLVNDELTSLEQKLTGLAEAHLAARGASPRNSNLLCRNLAIEACLNQPGALLPLAVRKFLLGNNGPVSVGYDEPRLTAKLITGFTRRLINRDLGRGLVGRELPDEPAVAAFVAQHYRPMPWYPSLDDAWRQVTVGPHLDSSAPVSERIPALPLFFLLALLGAALAVITPSRYQRFHIAWISSLAGLWFAVVLTGVINPRYRYVFEPFCLLYIALGAMSAWALLGKGLRLLRGRSANERAAVKAADRLFQH